MPRLRSIALCIFLFALSGVFSGCITGQKRVLPSGTTVSEYKSFFVVEPVPGDSYAKIAKNTLGHAAYAPFIADFNDEQKVGTAKRIVVPKTYPADGGARYDGLQMVPVLSYHKLSPEKSDKTTVTIATFEEQMRYLRDEGFRVVSMLQLYEHLQFQAPLPERAVVITFDDGWRSFYDHAFPILKKYGFPATLFVYTDLIVGSRVTMNWDMVKEVAEGGIDVQCHTKAHRNLARIDCDESYEAYYASVEKELLESRKIIRKKTGIKTDFLAYPYGAQNSLVVAMLKKYEYKAAFTVTRGGNTAYTDPYRLRRSMIFGDYDMEAFRKQLTVFHPWKKS